MSNNITLTVDYCYNQHKAAFEYWRYGEPAEITKESDALIIKYQSGAWFHYRIDDNDLVWW